MATSAPTIAVAPRIDRTALRRIRLPLIIGAAIVIFFVVLAAQHGTQLAAEQTANALALGAIYALIALGYTMVYGIIELINFAHGDVFMVGGFISMFFLTRILSIPGSISDPLPLLAVVAVTLVVAMTLTGLLGVTIERFAYRPLRKAPKVAPLITAVGVSFILQNVIERIFGPAANNVPQLFSLNIRFNLFGASIPWLSVAIVLAAVGLMIGLHLFISRTRLGRAMRSTAQDQEAAQLMGVDLNQTIAVTFFIGSALAGAAGLVWGLNYGYVRFDLGFNGGLKAFTAAVLGGIGNTTGAALGGFLIAFVEVAASAFGLSRLSEAVVFLVLIIILVFRPAGLLGQQIGERA